MTETWESSDLKDAWGCECGSVRPLVDPRGAPWNFLNAAVGLGRGGICPSCGGSVKKLAGIWECRKVRKGIWPFKKVKEVYWRFIPTQEEKD